MFSGRAGLHLYWVLSECLPIQEIEGWNKVLAQQLDGDSCGESNRLLRIPETVNEKKDGQQVELLEMSGCVHDPSKLRSLPAPSTSTLDRQISADPHTAPEWLRMAEGLSFDPIPTDELDGSCLLRTMNSYLDEMPKRGWRSPQYKSRSEIEQAIIYRLVSRGASDEQITELGDQCFARHFEERWRNPTDPGDYLSKSISKARERFYRKCGLISSPGGGWPKRKEAKYRHRTVGDLKQVLLCVSGQPKPELVADIQHSLGCSRSSAYNYVKKLVRACLIEEKGGRLYLSSTARRWKDDQTQL